METGNFIQEGCLKPQLPVDQRVEIVRAQSRSVGNEITSCRSSTRSPASTVYRFKLQTCDEIVEESS